MKFHSLLTALLAFGCFCGLVRPTLADADLLTVGSPAPALDVEHWVQDGKGKFKPVTKFESGKVYVVEFWATWCGPCVMSMPHLAETQHKYADQGVQIVSISDEDLETVEKFLERAVPQRGPAEDAQEPAKQTFRELTSAYCLTTDPDQSSYQSYMNAAAQGGIPTAFLVGKTGLIEWIGHPMQMDEPLAAVVDGNWDREKFASEFKPAQLAEVTRQKVMQLASEQDFEGALKVLDKALQEGGTLELKNLKLQLLLISKKTEEAVTLTQSLFVEMADNPEQVNALAWNVFEMSSRGAEGIEKIVDASIEAAMAAAKKSQGELKGSILDTAAHLHFIQGNLDEALALETEAAKLVGPDDRYVANFLKELQEAKAASEQDK